MIMTEAQLRKMIRKEILKEMGMGNMPHNDEKPSLGFNAKEIASMIAGGVAGNAALIGLQNFFHKNPEILQAVKSYLESKGLMEE